jgi:hypothetical protein
MACLQRQAVEHYFRFGGQRLLMSAYQKRDVGREGSWLRAVSLAYIQLQ